MEEYLLGKKRFTSADLRNTGNNMKEAEISRDEGGPLTASNSMQSIAEIETRLREDPLLAIKKRELEMVGRARRLQSQPSDARTLPRLSNRDVPTSRRSINYAASSRNFESHDPRRVDKEQRGRRHFDRRAGRD